ncbi:hypothetical protein RUND412_004606 [Rhizina undulata]
MLKEVPAKIEPHATATNGAETECGNLDVAAMDRQELQDAVVATYSSLTHKQLQLLLALRSLPTCGDAQELAFRLAVHELSHRADLCHRSRTQFTPPPSTPSPSFCENVPQPGVSFLDPETDIEMPDSPSASDSDPDPSHLPSLPPELWADIFEFLNDWELSTALGIRTNLRRSADWALNGTKLDHVILSGSVSCVENFLRTHPGEEKFTKYGAKVMVRFGYTKLLSFFLEKFPAEFRALYTDTLKITTLASHYGQTKVLSWWLKASDPARYPDPLPRDYDEEPLNDASREGHIHVLQWWKSSGLPLRYGLVMDVASSFGHLSVLEWWKNSGLTLNYRHALLVASYRGEVEVLEWWKRSGLRLVYDKEVLVEATKFNRSNVLEWWSKSGLRVEYLLCDIEAALEDAYGGGKEARAWWMERGCRFDVTVKEWMEYKVL